MPLLIDRQTAENTWTFVNPEQPEDFQAESIKDLLVPFALLQQAADAKPGRLGVQINGEQAAADLQPWLAQLSLIAIEFPMFRDGRGYSLARQIRRLGYTGELRAVGDIGRDQLGYLERCGFNAFALADEKYKPEMLSAFTEISVRYQGAADDPRPIYRQS